MLLPENVPSIELPKPSRKFVLTICLISLLIITDEN
ncbi:MAG: hypothetical protein CM15mP108_3130 [Gammaproteobacteria bacterium]|nr:MAG: hypothetical protein CM15mP108_3130 [Gammaproteobacteria bacterium]